jgi:hypothetical protein
MEPDLLEDLLDIEENFYNEGYALGLSDGTEAGYMEGAVFAVEKGYEKLFELGKLYGKSLVWMQRLTTTTTTSTALHHTAEVSPALGSTPRDLNEGEQQQQTVTNLFSTALDPTSLCESMSRLPVTAGSNSRLEKNIRNLLSLLDPATLSLENTEDAISEIEDRLKNAILKAKLIQRILGERDGAAQTTTAGDGDGSGSIEDISSLNIRH